MSSSAAEADIIYATALIAAIDFCPACGFKTPKCAHVRAVERLLADARFYRDALREAVEQSLSEPGVSGEPRGSAV